MDNQINPIIKRSNKDGAIDPERGFSLFPNGRTVYYIRSLKQVIQTTCINCNYHLSNYNNNFFTNCDAVILTGSHTGEAGGT